MDDLYHEEILEHAREPQNFGVLDDADVVIQEANASCGDQFTFYIKLSEDKQTIETVQFEGQGCAISTAACSLLSEAVVGRTLREIQAMDVTSMQELIGAEIGALRLKCLMLPLRGIVKAL